MFIPIFLAALAALPTISAQSVISAITDRVSSTATICATQHASTPLSSGETIETLYNRLTTTSTYRITTTECSTTTVTPVSTFTDVTTTTNVVTTTDYKTPAAIIVPTPYGFFPLINTDDDGPTSTAMVTATAIPRIRRYEDRKDINIGFSKRQDDIDEGLSWGFQAFDNGTYADIRMMFPARVDCNVTLQVKETIVTAVYGGMETETAQQVTASIVSTSTEVRTSTVTEQRPAPTMPAACQDDNMVDHIAVNGSDLYFNLIRYRTDRGFPVENELVSTTGDARSCCVRCHTTPYCAGSFWARNIRSCHLRLTQPPSNNNNNTSLPLGSGTTGTASSNNTCASGSLSLYMGVITGKIDFSAANALTFSNGPCGWFSVDPR